MIRFDSKIYLKNLKITSNLQEIIDAYKQFKRNIFENWCGLHYQEANDIKNQFWDQIKRCAESADPYDSVRVCIGSIILAKYSQTFRDNCSSILCEIRPQRENSLSTFIAIYTAKHAKRFRTSSQFTQSYLQVISESLKSNIKLFDRHYLNLLYYLTVYATKEIDKYTSKFYETLLIAFVNQSEEIRMYALHTLNNYFRLTRHKLYPQSLMNQAAQLISTKKIVHQKTHGGMLIIISLIDFFPEYFLEKDIPSIYMKTINRIRKDSKMINVCNLIQIALASNFPSTFGSSVETFLKSNWPDDKSKLTIEYVFPISFALKKYPQGFFNKNNNINLILQLLDLIKNLLSKTDDRKISDFGPVLLLNFMKNLPNEFENYAEKVASVLLFPDYSENFIPTFKQIIFQNEIVRKFVLRDIDFLLNNLLDDKREEKLIIFARLIASLPSIPDKIVQKFKDPLLNLLNHPNINLRKLIPPALMSISKYLPSQISTQIGITLITTAVIEDSTEMRLIILNSFAEPYPSYLSYPNTLEYFTILVNDESFIVRKAALKILGGVSSKNPAMIYPMFRRILLDILFLLSASKSLRMKSDAILCLPIIFSSVVPILPIYVPIFMPIAFEQLKKNLSVAANEIDNPQNFKTIPFYQHPMMSYNSISSYQRMPYDRQLSNSLDFKPQINGNSNPALSPIKESVAQRIITEEQMSFFERMFTTKITENFIWTIGCICEKSFELIRPFVKEITKILLETIGRAAYKSILLASIDTLGKIIDQLGPIEAANITDLNTTLLKLGSRIISSRVYTAIFRTLGKIGPITPQNSLNIEISEVKAPENVDLSVSRDDYFVRAVVTALFFVLDDKSESDLHSDAHLALSRTFSTCKKSVNSQRLFKSYVARLLTTIRALAPDDRSKYFKYIATILRCPVEWLQPFSGNFFQLIEDLWDTENNVDVLDIIPKLASRLKDEFSHYLPRVVTHLLDALTSCCSISSYDMCKAQLILKTICELSKFASQFVFIIINQICVIVVELKVTDSVLIAALDSIRSLVQNFNCTTYSSIIMRACFHLSRKNPALKEKILQVIYSLAISTGPKFINYSDSIKDYDLLTPEMEQILNLFALKKRKKITDFHFIVVDKPEPEIYEWKPNTNIDENDLQEITRLQIEGTIDEQWKSWIRTFIKAFITHSPVPAIQSCIPIAEKSPLFNRKIFNPAFLSCWANMKNESRYVIQTYVLHALSLETPPSVVTALIGLVEFIDRAGMPMEGNYFNRTKSAMNAGKRTFALYCAQRDFDTTTPRSALNIELLIQIYSQLGMFDEVRGMEKIASSLLPHNEKLEQKLSKLELSEQWDSITDNFDAFLSKPEQERKHSNVIFAHAFYHLKDWKNFETSINQNQDSPNSIIMNCLRGLFLKKDISSLIEEGFVRLGKQGGPLFLHGFTAVAPYIVNAEQLVEIQEYFTNKNIDHWEKRLVPIKCTFNTIRPLLHMRIDLLQNEGSLKVFPHQLSFLKLARKANEWKAFKQFYDLHFSSPDNEDSIIVSDRMQQLQIKYEYLHFLKKKGSVTEALNYLDNCVSTPPKSTAEKGIYSKFYFKKAKWIARLNNKDVIEQMSDVIHLCNMSLEMRPHHYNVKNLWSWANMHLFTYCTNENMLFVTDQVEKNNKEAADKINPSLLQQAAVDAITGFASCLKLDFKDTFFDLLQMTSILFRSTNIHGVFESSISAVKSVQLKRFIKVIPQLLVYQYTHSKPHQHLVYEILSKLLSQYPNSVIFPLLFVNNTKRNTSIGVADMLKSFAMNHSEFYESAVNVLNGLKKACITLPEYFTEALSKISSKIKKMKIDSLAILIPMLIDKLKRALIAAESPYEAAFVQKYGKILKSVIATLEKYMKNKNLDDFVNATSNWHDFYSAVNKDLQNELQVSLKYVAPELENFDNSVDMSPVIALMSSTTNEETATPPRNDNDEERKLKPTITRITRSETKERPTTLIGKNANLLQNNNNNEQKNVNFDQSEQTNGNPLFNFHAQQVLSPSNYDSENSLVREKFNQKKATRENFYKMDEKNNKNILLNFNKRVVDSPLSDDSFVQEKNKKDFVKNRFYGGIVNNRDNLTSILNDNEGDDDKNQQPSSKQVASSDLTNSDNSLNAGNINNKSSKVLNNENKSNITESPVSDDSFEAKQKERKQKQSNFYGNLVDDTKQPPTKAEPFLTSAKQVPSPDITDSDGSLNVKRFNLNDKSFKLSALQNKNNKGNTETKQTNNKVDSPSDDSFEVKREMKMQKRKNFYGNLVDDSDDNKDQQQQQPPTKAEPFLTSAKQVTSPDITDSDGSLNVKRFNLNDKSFKLSALQNKNNKGNIETKQPNNKVDSPSDDSFEVKREMKMQKRKNFYGNLVDDSDDNKDQQQQPLLTSSKQVLSPDITDSDGSLNVKRFNLNDKSSRLSALQNKNNKGNIETKQPNNKVDSPSDDSFEVKREMKMQKRKNFYGNLVDDSDDNKDQQQQQQQPPTKAEPFLTSAKQVPSPDITDSDGSLNIKRFNLNDKSSRLSALQNKNNKGNIETKQPNNKVDSPSDDSFEVKREMKMQKRKNFYGNLVDDSDDNKDQQQQQQQPLLTSSKQVTSPDITDSDGSLNIKRFNLNDKSSRLSALQNKNNKGNTETKQTKDKVDSPSDDSFEVKRKLKMQKRKNFYGNLVDNSDDNKDQQQQQPPTKTEPFLTSAKQVPSPDITDSDGSLNVKRFNLNDKSFKLSALQNKNNNGNMKPKQPNNKVDSPSDDSFEVKRKLKMQKRKNFYGNLVDDSDDNKDQQQQPPTKAEPFLTSAKQVPSPDITDSDGSLNVKRFNLNDNSFKLSALQNKNNNDDNPPSYDNQQDKANKNKSPRSEKFLISAKQVSSSDITDSDSNISAGKFSLGSDRKIRKQSSDICFNTSHTRQKASTPIKKANSKSTALFTALKAAKVDSPSSASSSENLDTRGSKTVKVHAKTPSPKASSTASKSMPTSSVSSSSSLPHVVNMKSATATASKLRAVRRSQCQLAVFNTFDPDKPIITISKFMDNVKIKLSKHRPRKIVISGSDGKLYKFLLKGHEDLRVDQRMMQYFELMNSIASASMPQITITGVTPLAPNVGLIQWVKQCDLMKGLIIEFRKIEPNYNNNSNSGQIGIENNNENNNNNEDDKVKMFEKINKELSMMRAMTVTDVDLLMPIHRLEPIKTIMKETSPNDLRDMMWLKAQDAESWVRHTFNFSKTSAVMSIVGYIIGLGDRHPANIMIQRSTGRVIHIDFGDYFEVSKERKYLAEKIPFRLTRMMISTFGPCGIEGSFRATCEETVQTIREHREAVMSILEIFIREPCSSGDFFYNTNKSDNKMEIISGSVGINQFPKNGSNKTHDKLLKNMSTISKKIDGLDFDNEVPLSVSEQVDMLISSATDVYNLAYLYHGWNPLW